MTTRQADNDSTDDDRPRAYPMTTPEAVADLRDLTGQTYQRPKRLVATVGQLLPHQPGSPARPRAARLIAEVTTLGADVRGITNVNPYEGVVTVADVSAAVVERLDYEPSDFTAGGGGSTLDGRHREHVETLREHFGCSEDDLDAAFTRLEERREAHDPESVEKLAVFGDTFDRDRLKQVVELAGYKWITDHGGLRGALLDPEEREDPSPDSAAVLNLPMDEDVEVMLGLLEDLYDDVADEYERVDEPPEDVILRGSLAQELLAQLSDQGYSRDFDSRGDY